MAYETSYDVGLKPFSYDKHRGKWASPKDFFFACIGHAFKVDAVFVLPSLVLRYCGIYGIVPFAIIMMLCTIPIVFMQSFLGQFSSSGFISVFRIAPIFKGVGYVSLAVNLMTLVYYSVFGAIPLFYFFHSMRPTLPWSCEHNANWEPRFENGTTICHILKTKTEVTRYTHLDLPSQKFFVDHISDPPLNGETYPYTYSWQIFACTIIVWLSAWAVLRQPIGTVGRIIRYSTIAMLVALSVCFLRFAFLPGAFKPMELFNPYNFEVMHLDALILIPLMALTGMGPGWGSVLTMSSYNNFKTNITKYSWGLPLAQFGLMMASGFSWVFIENFLIKSSPEHIHFQHGNNEWMQALAIPTALSFIEMPHFWTLLFFGMMTLGAVNLLIVQLFSVLTSLFDEYEVLRLSRKEVIMIAVGVLCLISVLFCSNHGILTLELLCHYSMLSQALLNIILLVVVLWVYGRERFQRDVRFMIDQTFSTWMVNILRFVAPIFLSLSLLVGLIEVLYNHTSTYVAFAVVTMVVALPWVMIPGYCIFKLTQTSGLVKSRFKRCCRPTDWYPVDPDDRQRYDEMFSGAEINHQLTVPEGDA